MERVLWMQCFRCKQTFPSTDITGRQTLVSVTKVYNSWGIQVGRYDNYSLMNFCLTCDAQETAHQKKKRRLIAGTIGVGGIGLLAWSYLGILGLVSAGIIIVLGAFVRRPQRALLARKE